MTFLARITAGLFIGLIVAMPKAMADIQNGGAMSPPQRVSIDNAVYTHFQKCWKLPEASGAHSVVVRFELKRDGSLVAAPKVLEIKPPGAPDAAVQAAVTAVRSCPSIALPPEAYDYWRLVTIKFLAQAPARLFGASAWPQ